MNLLSTKLSPMRAWLELVRLPNLFTVPGDVLAGAGFAAAATFSADRLSFGQLALAVVAAVAVYAAGLIDNDLVDCAEDAAERPARPLPSGRVSAAAASRARAALFLIPALVAVSGVMPLAWVVVQMALVAAVLVYNRIKGLVPEVGFVLMGVCRGLNLLGGAALAGLFAGGAGESAVAAVALCWTLYVAGITVFASHETRCAPGAARYLLAIPVAALALVGLLPSVSRDAAVMAAAAALAGTAGVVVALRQCPAGPDPARVPRTVGQLVRLLIPMQALLCLSVHTHGAAWGAAALLLVCWSLAVRLGRRFYAS